VNGKEGQRIMGKEDLYSAYPHDKAYIEGYIDYQRKYSSKIRESDRVVLEIVAEVLRGRPEPHQLLDIGCSTGNLLRHMRRAFPGIALSGGDLSDLQLQACRQDPDLAGITFMKLDIRALPRHVKYDVIVANAILYGFDEDGFSESIASIAGALKPGGSLVAFDYFHPWKQEIAIIERSGNIPGGHPLHFRSYDLGRSVLTGNGLTNVEFRPFSIPIDLPMPDYGTEALETYTVPTADGRKLLFRGAIAQPWCHLIATNKAV
jgi:SAM-dependent methyltransferase